MAYITGDRQQMTFFPPCIDDYITKDASVRVYDAFVEALNFEKLGITLDSCKIGAHEYHPKSMLKLLIFGYAYGIRSSRKLERAAHDNLSFIWLSGNLKPDYRTIARFRKKNYRSLKKVLQECVRMCIKLDLIEGNTLFTDGTKIRSNASLKNNWTKEKCEQHLDRIYQNIDRILQECEQQDKAEESCHSFTKMSEELVNEQDMVEKVKSILDDLDSTNKEMINTTDADTVKCRTRNGTHCNYNVQATVDEKHGLLVTTEVITTSSDANQLSQQVKNAEDTLGKKPEIICADSGYYSLNDLNKIDKNKVQSIVPSQQQIKKERSKEAENEFSRDKFTYNKEQDVYICPAGKQLVFTTCDGKHKELYVYKAKAKDCQKCHYFEQCTTAKSGRRICRHQHEELKEKLTNSYLSEKGQSIYKLRKERAELPFAHIKHNMGFNRFLMRQKNNVTAEISIIATCYNMIRMSSIFGTSTLISKLLAI